MIVIEIIDENRAKTETANEQDGQLQTGHIWARWTQQDHGGVIIYLGYTALDRHADDSLKVGLKLTGGNATVDVESWLNKNAYNDDKSDDEPTCRDILDSVATQATTKNEVRTVTSGDIK